MRYVSIFSGVEAATLAWGPLGWEPVAFSEIEPFPCAVLAERWPDVPNLGDITKVDWKNEIHGAVDLVVGGSPCQSFSIAGKREGLKGASGLMFEYIRCVQELRPRWFLWENVPGALTSDDGGAFGQLLSVMDELGYCLAWRVLDAQFFGVAQRRRRLFLVGHLGAESPAEVLFEPDCLPGNPQSSREKRKELTRRAVRSAACAGFKYSAAPRANTIGYAEEQANTLTADWHAPAVFPLQGNMIGRADSAGPAGKGYGMPGDPAFTLNCVDRQCIAMSQYGTEIAGRPTARGDSSPCADADQNIVCMTGTQAHCHISDEISGCLTAHMGKDDAPVVVVDSNSENTANEAFGFAQNTRNEVRIVGDGTISGTLTANPGMKQTTFVCTSDYASAPLVRRLTPLECERLQGFPDNHTRISWNGKPADECPDGPRYKAIGNSMAVPVMRWLGERIEAADRI